MFGRREERRLRVVQRLVDGRLHRIRVRRDAASPAAIGRTALPLARSRRLRLRKKARAFVRPKQTGTDRPTRTSASIAAFAVLFCAASTSRTSSTRSGWTCNTLAGPTSSPCAHTHARTHACAALHIEQHAQPSGSVAVVVVVVARAGTACLTRSPSCWASRLRSRPPLLTRATLVTRSPWSSGTRKRAEL